MTKRACILPTDNPEWVRNVPDALLVALLESAYAITCYEPPASTACACGDASCAKVHDDWALFEKLLDEVDTARYAKHPPVEVCTHAQGVACNDPLCDFEHNELDGTHVLQDLPPTLTCAECAAAQERHVRQALLTRLVRATKSRNRWFNRWDAAKSEASRYKSGLGRAIDLMNNWAATTTAETDQIIKELTLVQSGVKCACHLEAGDSPCPLHGDHSDDQC